MANGRWTTAMEGAVSIEFDHVIRGVSDLDGAGTRLLSEHGLSSVAGGRHPGHGTGNRIVPLGTDYLELMAIVDRAEASESPLGRWVGEALRDGDRFLALCLRTGSLDLVAERLGLETLAMSRSKPNGETLRWRLAGLDRMMGPERLPFFIQWDVPLDRHPGREPADHRAAPLGLAWVELGGNARRIHEWVGTDGLDLRVVSGKPGVRALGIRTRAGEITIR